MALKYQLKTPVNPVVAAAGMLTAVSLSQQTIKGTDALVSIAAQGGTLTVADLKAALEAISTYVGQKCAEGYSVEVPGLCIFRPFARGKVPVGTSKMTMDLLTVGAKVRLDAGLRNAITSNAVIQQVPAVVNGPQFVQFGGPDGTWNAVTDNGTVEASSMFTVKGDYLKFNHTRADEGVWAVPTDPMGEAVKVQAFVRNENRNLTMQLPNSLLSGSAYWIEVRTRQGTMILRSNRSVTTVTIA